MNVSDSRKQAEIEKQRIIGRQKMIDEIHQHYARFGERVVFQIIHYASRTNGLRELVHKLSIQHSPRLDQHIHQVIVRYIMDKGVSNFLECVCGEPATSPPVTAAPTKPAVDPTPSEQKDDSLVWVDRRKNKERRTSGDRRKDVEVIFKNKRYGRDRRKSDERRKKQIPPPWPKNDTKDSTE